MSPNLSSEEHSKTQTYRYLQPDPRGPKLPMVLSAWTHCDVEGGWELPSPSLSKTSLQLMAHAAWQQDCLWILIGGGSRQGASKMERRGHCLPPDFFWEWMSRNKWEDPPASAPPQPSGSSHLAPPLHLSPPQPSLSKYSSLWCLGVLTWMPPAGSSQLLLPAMVAIKVLTDELNEAQCLRGQSGWGSP